MTTNGQESGQGNTRIELFNPHSCRGSSIFLNRKKTDHPLSSVSLSSLSIKSSTFPELANDPTTSPSIGIEYGDELELGATCQSLVARLMVGPISPCY